MFLAHPLDLLGVAHQQATHQLAASLRRRANRLDPAPLAARTP